MCVRLLGVVLDVAEAEAAVTAINLARRVDRGQQLMGPRAVVEHIEGIRVRVEHELVELVRAGGEVHLDHRKRQLVVDYRLFHDVEAGERLALGGEPALLAQPVPQAVGVQALRDRSGRGVRRLSHWKGPFARRPGRTSSSPVAGR